MFVSSQNLYIEMLTFPRGVMVFGGGVFGRY